MSDQQNDARQSAPRSSGRASSPRVNPLASVALITAAALVGVAVLAVQANGTAPKHAASTVVPTAPTTTPTNSAGQPIQQPDPLALPANSGKGKRIVYSLKGERIWLVGANDQVQQSIPVVPGTVPPPTGNYSVSRWDNTRRGGDGVPVQYVVLWGNKSDPSLYGFDAVQSLGPDQTPPKSTGKTTGVRMTQSDALVVWQFATAAAGTPVVVMP